MTPSSKRRLITDGLVHDGPDGPRLIAGRCTGCGALSFPTTPAFHHPSCPNRQLERVLLGSTGTLISYTVNYFQPPPPFRMDPFEPYAVGVARIDDEIQVIGMLTGTPFDRLRLGETVELVTERLYDDDDGTEVHTWKWRVVDAR